MTATDPGLPDAMDRIEALAGRHAVSARARGDSEEERRWLDVAIIIERTNLPDLIRQAKADALDEASNATGAMGAHILDCRFPDTRCDCGCITGRQQAHYWLRDRAAAIRAGA